MSQATGRTGGSRSDDAPNSSGDGHAEYQSLIFDEPGDEIREVVERMLGHAPVLQCSADLHRNGQYGETWIAADVRRVGVIEVGDHGPEVRDTFKLLEFDTFETSRLIGNGVLRARQNGRIVDLCHYTLADAEKFELLARSLQTLRSEGVTEELDAEEAAAKIGRCPQCNAVIPAWANSCPQCQPRRRLLMRLLRYVIPYWPMTLLTFVLMVVLTAIQLAPPYLTKILLDDVFPKRNLHLLMVVVFGGILGLRLVAAVLGGVRGYLMTWLGERVILGLKQEVYTHLHRLSLGFYDRQQTGSLMFRVNSDTTRLQRFIASGLQDITRNVLTSILICVILLHMHWKLALPTLIPVPFIVMASRRFGKKVRRIYRRAWRLSSVLNAIMGDALPGVRVVKAFDKERFEVLRFTRVSNEVFRTTLRASRISNVFYPSMGVLTALGQVTVWGLGGYWALHGQHITVGMLVAFISYVGRFYEPVNSLAQMNDQLQVAATSAERVFEILDSTPDVADSPNAVPLVNPQGRVTFENVTFGYPDGDPVIRDLSLDIAPGEMLGVVGPSGAGKTTFINLVCRFYDVSAGGVKIDGHDVRDLRVASLRSQIGVVLQEPYLFHGTIAENISYGRPDATREEIMRATEAAYALDVIISLPDGFDAMVGERGMRLSGGQKQRLSIARAILKNPRILILDEATSSVDTETEVRIRRAIESLVENRTTIAIAHRLSTLRKADRIAVLQKGELVELGTHEELLHHGGVFANLWAKQMDVAAEEAISQFDSGGAEDETTEEEMIQRLAPAQVCITANDNGTLRLHLDGQTLFDQVQAVRAFPLSDPWQVILFCNEENEPIAYLPVARALDDDSFQVLYQHLFWRYFVPQISEVLSIRYVTGAMTEWRVATNRGERTWMLRNRDDLRNVGARRVLVHDVDGNRYDIPDYTQLPPASQYLLQQFNVV